MNKSFLTIIYHSTVFLREDNIFLKKHWGRYMDNLSNSFDLDVICFSSKQKEFFHDYQINNKKINFRVTRHRNTLQKFFDKLNLFFLSFKKSDMILIFMPSLTSIFGAITAVIMKKKYCLYFGLEPFNSRYNFIIKFFIKYIIQNATFCLGTGSQVLSEIKKYNNESFLTKPNILFNKSDVVTKKRFNKNKNLLYVGSLEKRKGLIYLISALKNIEIRNNINKLYIVGDGELFDILKKNVIDYKLDNKIVFAGYISDASSLKKYYKMSDIFILPSFEEGFPRVIYESMINGLAILTTPVNSIPTILKDNSSAIFLVPGSTQSIEKSLLKLIKNPKEIKKISSNAQDLIFSIIDQPAFEQHAEIIKKYI